MAVSHPAPACSISRMIGNRGMSQSDPSDLPIPVIRRGFVRTSGRRIHYRVVGEGPPALFLHSSPMNSTYVIPDMLARAANYSCIAFDTPGFGLSDPLPLETMRVADLADAIVEAMDALGMDAVPVYGTHTGAAIALELGCRYPRRVTGLMLDGVPVFTREEVEPLQGKYFAPLVVDPLGGHYASTWTRLRDQSVWFPWCFREPRYLNEYDLAAPAFTQSLAEMFFACAAYYKPAYLAATAYCEDGLAAAAGLQVPAVFTATEIDMLYPHLDRLRPLPAGQEIVEIGNSHPRKREETGRAFARFGSEGTMLLPELTMTATETVDRQFAMDGPRAMFLRTLGDPASPPLLLLHDAPGSSLMVEPMMAELARDHFVIAPDLPGSGESDPLDDRAELADYAAAMWRLCDMLGLDRVTIRAIGFGASLGLEMAVTVPHRCEQLQVDGLLLPNADERQDMLARYAPRISVCPDGSHWYRLWLMLRDSQIYWPWYDTRKIALKRLPADFEGARLHGWAVDVMKQAGSYHRFIEAVLRHDAEAGLAALTVPIEILPDPRSTFASIYGGRLALLR